MSSANQNPVKLIIDPPQSGPWNMAVDESLMHSVGDDPDSQPVLRFYRWDEPTLSLGYFQKHDDRQQHSASRDIPLVRRNSGGGAIVHDLELTYSLTVHQDHFLAKKSPDLYRWIHESLVKTLQEFGVHPSINEELDESLEKNFLCFQRRAPNDVLLDGEKVCGSAQRKKFNAISQHGSVILKTSRAAPEITGITDISHKKIEYEELISRWKQQIVGEKGLKLVPAEISAAEGERAQEIQKVKFSTIKWALKR